ncbi:uncharacterized protein LOC116350500 [Contarinia nasturtii]|uniref:uncharacterized protein LOC116350500 n=1 Tax=Contarinia nasturtii TaxID=265458 RepID=UPI0012D3FDBC|nr:uncharacterized protein LOC116350500 [Contarinia nasturtii]
MAMEVISKLVFYVCHVVKGLFEIAVGKEEFIYDDKGNIISKLPSKRKQVLVFARNFLKEPVMLGSAFPSSQFTTDKLLAPIDFKNATLIVEYGAGVGNISIEILRRMRKDAKLLVFEINEDLIEFLKSEYHDDRFIATDRSAADVEDVLREHNLGQPDYVISGIPFSTMPKEIAKNIMKATKSILKPGGKFLVYQFRNKVLTFLTPYFKHIDRNYEIVNVPPMKLFFAYN